MKKILAALLALCLACAVASALAEKRSEFPELLRFTQKIQEKEYVHNYVYIARTYPQTANEQVNAEMKALIDQMAERGAPWLPAKASSSLPAYLDVGSYIYRSGEKYMSFLTVGRVAHEREQIYVDFDARAYDMETGRQLTLADIFPADSPAWDMMAREAETHLSAYYPAMAADENALRALCARETLEQTPFTLTPAKLSLHYRADELYPGRTTLMHVNLYYRDVRPYMTEEAQAQTDNSDYKFIALTYDDGGARGSSMNTMDQLRLYGANATFFVIGTNIASNHDVLCREQDAGFSLQSHNYEHVYKDLTADKLMDWKEKFSNQISKVTGTVPTYMRAPGGIYGPYIAAQVGYPLIQWSASSGDAGSDQVNAIAQKVVYTAKDGAVTLLHDLNPRSYQYTQIFLPELEARGFQCVTVDELFSHYGVDLLPDHIYYGCEDQAAAQ